MRIERTIKSIIGATKERKFISQNACMKNRQNLETMDRKYYQDLVNTSGPSVHNPIKVLKNWRKAYIDNLERNKLIDEINKPFKKPTLIKKIITKLFKK